jgi:transposase
MFDCHEHTIRATLKKWEEKGLPGLWEAKGRGAKAKCQDSDIEYLVKCLEEEQRTYNSKQLTKKLKEERSVDLSSDRLRRLSSWLQLNIKRGMGILPVHRLEACSTI